MPLLAYTHSGDPLIAPLMTDHEWEHLRSARDRDAWMPHGKGRAVPKISRLGTRFFAHPPGHTPEGARETDVHLYLKAQCLVGARAAGWDALPEQSLRVKRRCAMHRHWPKSMVSSAHQGSQRTLPPAGLFSTNTLLARQRNQREGRERQTAKADHLLLRASAMAIVALKLLPQSNP